ncbi:MAG: hypothetical protein H6710_13700 [Myxococcales bacterium]|nr:hypothetical protein [Myxococcales bacterium]MCB9704965.1 hypothetical protein [Myxococcales bacterium]
MTVAAEIVRSRGISLRAGLGLLLALVFPHLPVESPWVALVFVGGWLAYVIARVLLLREPGALRVIAAAPPSLPYFIGEGLFVSLALVLLLVWLDSAGLVVVPPGPAIVMVIAYLLFHTVVLYFLTGFLAGGVADDAKPRPRLRLFIRVAAFLAEESVLLAALAVTEGARVTALSEPWSLLDLLTAPLMGIVLLIFCYRPIAGISAAVTDAPLEIGEIVVLQAAALYVLAFTGSLPF